MWLEMICGEGYVAKNKSLISADFFFFASNGEIISGDDMIISEDKNDQGRSRILLRNANKQSNHM